jgi:tetratricopeptide (TPR) repeat protein
MAAMPAPVDPVDPVDPGAAATSPTPSDEGAGTVIGRYRLVHEIGEGGFGVVYLAEQQEPVRRRVALKIIKLGMDTKQVIARFEAERQALAMMDHPHIAKVLDAGTTDRGRPFFVMELVKGLPVTDYCDRNKLSIRERLDLFVEICLAVQHAHQKGIIHRDLKPSNVLVTLQHTERPVPKVIDFGVAKATSARLTEKTVFTQLRQFIGTPEYMSPEQAEMSELDIDTRSDIYSLGVLLYELLTGVTPFDPETLRSAGYGEIQRIICEQDPPRPSTRLSTLGARATEVARHRRTSAPGHVARSLRGELDWIVMKALEKDRTRRYETANGLALDVRRFLDDEPVAAGPPGAGYRLRKLVRRHTGAFAAAAVIALLLVAGVTGTTIGLVSAVRANAALDAALASEAEQRARAERRFEDVRRLANTFLFEIDDRLLSVTGSTPAREQLVRTGLEYLDQLAAEAEDDLELMQELADAYIRVGDIQGNPRKPNLGDSPAALESYRKSLALRDRLVAARPDSVTHALAQAATHQKIGLINSYLGRLADTLASYRQGLEIIEGLDAGPRADAEVRQRLSSAHAMIGDVHEQMGRPAPALESFTRGYDIAEALVEADPASTRARRDLSISCNEVGLALQRMKRLDEAEPYYRRALAIRRELAEAAPDDQRARRDMAISHQRLGALLSLRGRHEQALEAYTEAHAIVAAQAEADPDNARAAQDLSVFLEKLGNALRDLDRPDEALARYRECVAIRRRLLDGNPDNLYMRAGFALAVECVGDMQRRMGEWVLARDSYHAALAEADAVVETDPDMRLAQTVRCHASFDLGLVHEELAEWGEARRRYRQSLDVIEAAAQRGMQLASTPAEPDEIAAAVARCDARLAGAADAAGR